MCPGVTPKKGGLDNTSSKEPFGFGWFNSIALHPFSMEDLATYAGILHAGKLTHDNKSEHLRRIR